MKKLLFLLVLAACILKAEGRNNDSCDHQPIVSHVYWITIHAREAHIYDSLYRFFVTNLQIPQLFDTETYGSTRYFAIRAGNVILEPCGPFEFHENFGHKVMTRFNTLAFRPYESAAGSAKILKNHGFDITVKDKDELLNLTVDELCTDFLPVNISKSGQVNKRDKAKIDSLGTVLISNDGGPLGLQYIEEIQLGYRTKEYLEKWKKFLSPLEHNENLWILPVKPNIRFIKSEREEIIALVFKVKSLEKAAEYLKINGISGHPFHNRMEIDLDWSHGIRIILTD